MNQPAAILLVDDDPAVREVCHDALLERGHAVVEAATGAAALAETRPGRFDAAIVDLRLEDMDGMDVVAALRAADPETCIVIMTGYADLESAVEAVKHGVYEYVRKPFDADQLVHIVERGLERRRLSAENARLLRELQDATRRLMAHKRRLEQKIEIATEELASLIELGKQMATTADSDRLLTVILAHACTLTGAAGGHIFQLRDDRGLLVRASQGGYTAEAESGTAAEAFRLAGEAACLGRPVTDNDLQAERTPGLLPPGHPRSVLVVPIVMRGQIAGALSLYDKSSGPFTPDDADLMSVLAAQAAGVLWAEASHPPEPAPPKPPLRSGEFIAIEDLLGPP